MNKLSSLIKIAVSFLVTGGLLWWVLKDINWQEFGTEFGKVNYWTIIPAFIVVIIHYYIRAYRWKFLIKGGESVKLQTLFDAIMIGNFGTYILPLRAGEFMRPFMLSRNSNISFSTGFGSVVIERFFDLTFVLLSFGAILNFIEFSDPWIYQGAKALCVLAGGILFFITACVLAPKWITKFSGFFLDFLPQKVANIGKNFIADFVSAGDPLRDIKKLSMTIFMSLVVWLSVYLIFYIFIFLIPSAQPSILFSVAIAVIVALAVAAPSAPGFIGVYQTACVAGFLLFGYTKESGLVYALISHLMHYVLFIVYGLYLLNRDGLKLSEFKK